MKTNSGQSQLLTTTFHSTARRLEAVQGRVVVWVSLAVAA